MEFKGTKEKWNYEKGTYLENTIFFFFNNGEIIKVSNINDNDEATEETKANALLISKAPEMLEALKMFVEAVYTEEIIIKENYDNDGHENCGGRLYQKFKQLIKEATEL